MTPAGHARPAGTVGARAAQVASVLTGASLGWAGDAVRTRSRRPGPVVGTWGPERLRRTLEDLGATFVKLGQVLSSRPDLLPPAYQAELARLQDAAPPVPTAVLERCLAEQLGDRPGRAFARFDWSPLAAASIGQVHAATLHDGREVAVKVRRPGIVEQVELDLDLLHRLARAVDRGELGRRYDPVGLVEEFSSTLRAELDYVREAFNAERFARLLGGHGWVHVPRVVWDHATPGLLTLERVRGVKITDLPGLDRLGVERQALARHLALLYLEMVFEHGFFHADPHPGNFFVEAGGRIGMVDFGMVGLVGPTVRDGLSAVLLGLATYDSERLGVALLRLGVAGPSIDRTALHRDLDDLVARYTGATLGQLQLGPVLEDLMAVVRAHRLRLPRDLALLLKTVVMCEGVAVRLDPDFDFMTLLVPYAAGVGRTRPAADPGPRAAEAAERPTSAGQDRNR
ncbi:MAG: AarF/ABC1/UbiB kinase family protein [Acidimicrobiales bacterium]|nr:AarF/ABC1/UbiB kinase family protein [Acidimicrobiales bacterium]